MKKGIYITAAMLILLFLSGCRITKKETEVPFYETDIHTGQSGLVMEFIKNMPPSDVPKDSKFSVGLQLRNIGSYDIEEGIIKLKNVYPEYMETENDTKRFDLEGRSLYSAEGGFDTLSFKVTNKGLFPNQEGGAFIFSSFACYEYQTKASAEVCIIPMADERFMIGADVACQVKDITLRGGQGAPVSVSSIEPNLVPDFDKGRNAYTAFFKIQVNNGGNGYVTTVGGYENVCLGNAIKETRLDEVEITASVSGQELQCSVPLENEIDPNTVAFTCSGTIENVDTAYTTPLTITLDYGYISEEVSTGVIVRDYKIEEQCVPEHCIGDDFGVCSPVYGEEVSESASKNCGENKKCCTELKSLCERLSIVSGMPYECTQEINCDPTTTVSSYCAGEEDVCCIRGEPTCTPNTRCKSTARVCNNGYGGVDETKSCTEGVCCKDDLMCSERFPSHKCYDKTNASERFAFDHCKDKKEFYCEGETTKCCNTESKTVCQGNCVNTEGASCVPFGGGGHGVCDNINLICCNQDVSLCETEHAGIGGTGYGTDLYDWYCVEQPEEGTYMIGDNQVACDEIEENKCPGSKVCCHINFINTNPLD